MCSCSELRARARASLGGRIFSDKWMSMLLVILIGSAAYAVVAFTGIGPLLLIGPVSVAMAYYARRLAKNEWADFGDTLSFVGHHFVPCMLSGLLQHLFIFLWSCLFLVPGIVKNYSYAMTPYVRIDHPDWSAEQCITESRRLMNGHKWQLFLLQLSFLGWIIVGALAFGIGTLWVTAYMQAATAHFYEELVRCDLGFVASHGATDNA